MLFSAFPIYLYVRRRHSGRLARPAPGPHHRHRSLQMTRPTPLLDPCALPPTLDIVTAGRMLGIGRTTAYHLARYGQFPVPVLRIGGNYRVPTTPLLTLLGIDKPTSTPPTASQRQ